MTDAFLMLLGGLAFAGWGLVLWRDALGLRSRYLRWAASRFRRPEWIVGAVPPPGTPVSPLWTAVAGIPATVIGLVMAGLGLLAVLERLR